MTLVLFKLYISLCVTLMSFARGENPKIECAAMDGDPNTRRVLVSENIFWPNGLTGKITDFLIFIRLYNYKYFLFQ